MSGAFNLGKLFGIQFRLHYTWFLIFVLLTTSLSLQYFPADYPGWSLVFYWAVGIATSLLFFASVVAHELAHSLVGRMNDIPVKSITLFIFGGIAQMAREVTRPSAEFKMAAAGPALSILLGGLFGLLWFFVRGVSEPLAAMAFWLAYVNLLLAAFNLFPGFPLDGGRVFRSILWHFTGNYQRSTRIATMVGRGAGYLFILVGILIVFLRPFGLNWFTGLWLAFIGWFLQNAASASYRQAQWQGALLGLTASEVMTSEYSMVPSSITVSDLVQRYVFPSGRYFFLVAEGDRLEGILTLANIKSTPRQGWSVTQVGEIMTPVDKLKVAHSNQSALSILEQMSESKINQMPVLNEGRVIGLITRDSLLRFLRIRSELGR